MKWAPGREVRNEIKFWLDCLQVVTVAGAVLAAFITWSTYRDQQARQASEQRQRIEAIARDQEAKAQARADLEDQRHREQQQRAIEQENRGKEQLAAMKRELQRPYQEKKLALYLDAARVVAHLSSSPDVNKEATEARFWELYWGELAFVESRSDQERPGGTPSVERLMVEFCHQYFTPIRCVKGASLGPDNSDPLAGAVKTKSAPGETGALELARNASKEIRDEWERLGR
jgi:hypothetical protein